MPTDWKPDIDPEDPALDGENVDFVWREAKERMAATVSSYDILVNKAHIFLGFNITVTTALVAYLVNAHARLAPVLAYCLCTAASAYFLLRMLWAKQIDVMGYMPDRLFTKDFMGLSPKAQKAWLIVKYGRKIGRNVEITEAMGVELKMATMLYMFGLAVLLGGLIAPSP